MGKISLNVLLLVILVLVVVYVWRSKRREVWSRSGRCLACGGAPGTTGKDRRICADCAQTRTIQRWLTGFIVLVVAGIAAWLRWSR
jgi:hypothetical protein